MEFLTGRTHLCHALRPTDVDKVVRLSGWANAIRDMGGVLFVDVRDRYGLTQLVFEPGSTPEAALKEGARLKPESSLTVEGVVRMRSNPNAQIPTGLIEVVAQRVQAHNIPASLPFEVGVEKDISQETRMRWRFLDLRRAKIRDRLPFRHQVIRAIREHFDGEGFVDVETPILFKSTPEGARDYLVPSRIHRGQFYALPQSPQTLKQTLMSAGLDRYYQIARCFRDEDLRGDRQPEFTQLDMEMSFPVQEDVQAQIEACMKNVFRKAMLGVPHKLDLAKPFPRMSWRESLRRFGHDAPDTRFGLEHHIVNELFARTGFQVVKGALEKGGDFRVLVVPGGAAKVSRKDLDALTEVAKSAGAGGLLWLKRAGELSGPLAKALDGDPKAPGPLALKLFDQTGFADGDLMVGVADKPKVAATALHKVRLALANLLKLIDPMEFHFHFIVDFPLFEPTEDGGITYSHHPFCFPHPEDRHLLESDPLKVRAWSYDLVLNGTELGSGSIRNHEVELQRRIFRLIGVDDARQDAQFGFLYRALEHGAPPHGGMALGIDRIVALLAGETDIREYIAFPKTHKGTDLFSECPSPVDGRQLRELGISFETPEA